MKKLLVYIAFIAFAFTSCDSVDLPEITGTKVQAMSGEWFVYVADAAGNDLTGYTLLTTSNTAADNATDLLWDDHGTWPSKFVAKVNIANLTFDPSTGTANLANPDAAVSIKEGKVIKNGATSTGGNVTDSIYVRLEFADDPGNDYIYTGYKRTGFLEDEH